MTPSKQQENKGNPLESDHVTAESDQVTGETDNAQQEIENNSSKDQGDPEAENRDPSKDQTEIDDPDDHKLTESDLENENGEINEVPGGSEMAGSHQSDQSNDYTEAAQPELQESEKCTSDCKYRATAEPKGKSIQCCLCQTSFHKECVNIDARKTKKDIGFWSCPDCRLISRNVKSLQKSIDHLLRIIQNGGTNGTGSFLGGLSPDDSCSHDLLETMLSDKSEECERLKKENRQLKQDIFQAHKDCSDSEGESDCQVINPKSKLSKKGLKPSGHLIIGDSLIRDVVPSADGIQVACMRGAKFQDVKKKLNDEKRLFDSITVVCGTNHLSSKMNADTVTVKAEQLLNVAKKHSKCVRLSSVPPRLDNVATDQQLQNLNERLSVIAETLAVNFIDHDKNFRFLSEIPDERLLLPDGLHLSPAGVQRLIQNLKLNDLLKCGLDLHTDKCRENNKSEHMNMSANERRNKICTKSKNGVTIFFGKDSIFSNLNMTTPIMIDGQKYNCNEQYYAHSVATFFHDKETAEKVLMTDDPYELVALHKKVKNYSQHKWLPHGEKVLFMANLAKYTQNGSARKALLDTADDFLGEASYSRKWGIGIPIQDKNALDYRKWTGLNIMGNILMKIRDTLTNKRPLGENLTLECQSYNRQYNRQYDQTKACWNCGEQNHVAKNYKHGCKLQCNSCYEYGHKAKFCYPC